MIAASAPDLDGLSLLGGWKMYYEIHHVLLHNLAFAVVLSTLLALFSRPRVVAWIVYFALMHLHFLLDLLLLVGRDPKLQLDVSLPAHSSGTAAFAADLGGVSALCSFSLTEGFFSSSRRTWVTSASVRTGWALSTT